MQKGKTALSASRPRSDVKTIATIKQSLEQLENWAVKHDYKAYEPFDGLDAWLRPLAINKQARQALVQVVRRAPVNLRPALGIKPAITTKGHGYFARGYLKLYEATKEASWLERADYCFDWLLQNANRNYPGISWGNHFDYQTRGYYLQKGEPTVVWTALIGHAFVDAYELLKRPADLESVKNVAGFIVEGLEQRVAAVGKCISYIPGHYVAIHNANMLAAGFLARAFGHVHEPAYKAAAEAAVAYTVSRQHENGSWWYGEEEKFHWVDNWHTAYVLDSLWFYMKNTGDFAFKEQFRTGTQFWLDHFFLDDGTPRYYAEETYPIEIQSASQAIESLCLFSKAYDSGCLKLAQDVALWTINNMQDVDGHFYYRQTRRWLNKTPMLHWGQATMFHALASLLFEVEAP